MESHLQYEDDLMKSENRAMFNIHESNTTKATAIHVHIHTQLFLGEQRSLYPVSKE